MVFLVCSTLDIVEGRIVTEAVHDITAWRGVSASFGFDVMADYVLVSY